MNDTIIRHLSEAEVTAYIDGEVTDLERAAVHAHLDACDSCREEVGHVVALLDTAPASSKPAVNSRVFWRAGIGLAFAAGLASLFLVRGEDEVAPPVMRAPAVGAPSESRRAIQMTTPVDNAVIKSGAQTFAWQPVAASLYRFTLLRANGVRVYVTETNATAVTLPDTVKLESGMLYFWYVDAITDGIAASSGMHRFTTSP